MGKLAVEILYSRAAADVPLCTDELSNLVDL